MRESQRSVTGHRTPTVEDSSNPIGGHLNLSAELGGAHIERFKLFGEMLAGMNGTASHSVPH
jgi:hypothetical protein